MNSSSPQALQAENHVAAPDFPQPIPAVIQSMTGSAAIQAVLHLFDAGAITAQIAEGWLLTLENVNS